MMQMLRHQRSRYLRTSDADISEDSGGTRKRGRDQRHTATREPSTPKKQRQRPITPAARVEFLEEHQGVDEAVLGNTPLYIGGGLYDDIPTASVDGDIQDAVNTLHSDITGGTSLPEVETAKENERVVPTPAEAAAALGIGRIAKLRMVRAYRDRFSDYFSESLQRLLRGIEKKEEGELDELLAEVKYAVFEHTQPGILKETYFALVEMNEGVFGAGGLRRRLEADDHVQDLLDEVNIKYQHNMYVEPEYRLVYCTLAAGALMRRINGGATTTVTKEHSIPSSGVYNANTSPQYQARVVPRDVVITYAHL